LREINTSRYMEEFHEVCKIGSGEFGSVYDCVNRLDGCHYAIKKSRAPVAESIFEYDTYIYISYKSKLVFYPFVVTAV